MQQSKRFFKSKVLKNENYPYLVSKQLLNHVITIFIVLNVIIRIKSISRLTFKDNRYKVDNSSPSTRMVS